MNTDGDIRIITAGDKLAANEIPIQRKPNPNCKTCWGKGYVRWIIQNIRETRVCDCVKERK